MIVIDLRFDSAPKVTITSHRIHMSPTEYNAQNKKYRKVGVVDELLVARL